ncbi:exonuclease SbcCD subunit D [Azospirillum doebereinerae]|uniref:metallophosphoesterase family protein n=1 Tax=Azospirillum doebereinerae TaxID=92933 RepID=UPI00384D814C
MRSLRVLHTADWHLGQTLHGVARDPEHARFLDWLLDRIGEHGVDALVIAGDVFDGQNPPIPALALFYRFLARAKTRFPALDVVVLAGNHDSASRLEAPSPSHEGDGGAGGGRPALRRRRAVRSGRDGRSPPRPRRRGRRPLRRHALSAPVRSAHAGG